jgi:hypothetical protein
MINYSQMPSLGQTVENYNANIDQIKANAKNDEVFREVNKKIAEAESRIKLMEIGIAARRAKEHFRLWPMYSADYKRELDTPQKKLMYNAERLSNVVFNPLGVMAGATPDQVGARRAEKLLNKALSDHRAKQNQAGHGVDKNQDYEKSLEEHNARIQLLEIKRAATQAQHRFSLWPMYSADYKRELDTPQKKLMYNAERLSNIVFNPLGVMAGATPDQVRARKFEKMRKALRRSLQNEEYRSQLTELMLSEPPGNDPFVSDLADQKRIAARGDLSKPESLKDRLMRMAPLEEDPFSSPAVGMEEDPFAPTPLDRIKMALGMSSAAEPEDEFEVFSPAKPVNSAMNAASAALLKRAEMYNQMMGNPMRAVR